MRGKVVWQRAVSARLFGTRRGGGSRTCRLPRAVGRGRALRAACLAAGCAVLLAATLRPAGTRAAPPVPPDFQKGLSFAAWWAGQYQEPGAALSLAALQETGANWISLIVTAYQEHYDSTTIDYSSPHTPTDADLVHVIALAHRMGLKVMLKPHLDLADEAVSGKWRGDIGSGFVGEDQWAAWFESYEAFIEHYAELAQAHGVEQFCIGTELLGTTHRAAEWRKIAADVRAVYGGPIVYAALHSGEEREITWWDAVDLIGVDAYYPLNHDPALHPTVEQLEPSWGEPKTVLAGLYAAYGKKIIFTEIGYRSHHGCSVHPWDSLAQSEIDDAEQAHAYEAAFRQVYGQPWLGGMFWWSWYADRFKSGPCDDSYSPLDKPAEDVIRAWYGGIDSPDEPPLLPDYHDTLDLYAEGLAGNWQDWSWGAVVDLASTDLAHSGTRAIRVATSPWGALSLRGPSFDPRSYAWLEFYVRAAVGSAPDLQVFLDAADGTRLAAVPVNDCRFSDGPLGDAGWTRVRIPVSDLDPDGRPVDRVSIADRGGTAASFWVDDLRFLAGKEPVAVQFLPFMEK